ncbi:MAG: biopolymer transporter ExbD [Chitinivibrionales bacterium]|nr:biopolymer transporter ExbD [Chitinivibrionales bacterium]MBD3356522.1 biopolymer transporter ExbD [Chitinivibrionales bacterium]
MLKHAFELFDEEIDRAELSMTPLIDMVFLLLIFFVVTTTFTKETGISVDKARAATSQIIENKMMLIAIDNKGNYRHDERRQGLDEVVAAAAAASKRQPELNVVIIPDRAGNVEPLITLMDRLRREGVYRFSLGTQAKAE